MTTADGTTQVKQRTVSTGVLARLNAKGFRLVQALDLLAVVAILVGAISARYGWAWPTYSKGAYAVSFTFTTIVFLLTFYFGGLYDREPRLGRPPVLPRVARLSAAATGIVAVANLAVTALLNELGNTTRRALPLPTYVLVTLMLLSAVAVTVIRQLSVRNAGQLLGPPRALLVGDATEVAKARAHLDVDEGIRLEIVGTSAGVDDLVEVVERTGATDVILLASRWLGQISADTLRSLDARDVVIHQRVSALETMYGLQRVREIGGMPFVKLRAHTISASRLHFKRFTDIIWLVLLAPVFAVGLVVGALWTRIAAGSPVLYRQARVGVDGRHFQLVKFRTMRPDAEAMTGATWADKEDPRVIPACRWMRATRLDELPQVVNIMRGEMSLVGPRPERPELTAAFEAEFPNYGRRHEVPPGLTGLAQIHGRYHTDPEYKLGHDLQYLVNWSPVLDLEILVRTVWVVLARRV